MHALRFFPSVSLGYWGKFFGWPVPGLAKDVRAGGAPSSVGGSVGTFAGPDLRRGSPPGPGRGIQAFSRESPDAKSRGGGPPPPLVLGAARSHSLVLAWRGAAGR